jgi:hypothetical protein
MLLTAPELNHLAPLTGEVETVLLSTWISRMMMSDGKGAGIRKQPHWECRFKNNSVIVSRIPNTDGKGVLGQHVTILHVDEAQSYPIAGWRQVAETLNSGDEGSSWRCIAEGQLILTARGLIPIEQVIVGDELWTHRGRWRSVVRVYDNGVQDCIRVTGRGNPAGIVMTPGHRVLTRQMTRKKGARSLDDGETWGPISQLSERTDRRVDAWASPTDVTSQFSPPPLRGVDVGSLGWLWLYGLYLAEGYSVDFEYRGKAGGVQRHRRVAWCVNDLECEEVADRLHALGFRTHLYRQGRSVKVVVAGWRVQKWLSGSAGQLAAGKRLAPWVFGLDEEQRRAVFEGMVYGDGSHSKARDRYEYVTTSHALALGFRLLAQTLGYVCGMMLKPAEPRTIDGRIINSGECWTVTAVLSATQRKRQILLSDGMAWGPVNPRRDFHPAGPRHVYDLEVEEDHSYVVEGVVVSNCHGVSLGLRDDFFEKTQPGSGWKVHRPMAMHRPTWSKEERDAKELYYGGTRQSIDFRRNIYGEHCNAANVVFLLANLVACSDLDRGSVYNSDVYRLIRISSDLFRDGAPDHERAAVIRNLIQVPEAHFTGYSQRAGGREVGSPKGYSAYWAGQDLGLLSDPSEILVCGARRGEDFLEVLLRIQLKQIRTADQKLVVEILFETYGDALKGYGIDMTGLGRPIWDELTSYSFGDRIHGFDFGKKYIESFEPRQLKDGEIMKDLARMRQFKEIATDVLRNRFVDPRRIRFPYDREISLEWSGVTYSVIPDARDSYTGRRIYSGTSLHTLDAGRCLVGAIHIPPLEAMLEVRKEEEPVMDFFPGAMTW